MNDLHRADNEEDPTLRHVLNGVESNNCCADIYKELSALKALQSCPKHVQCAGIELSPRDPL